MKRSSGYAARLYASQQHPRLLIDEADIRDIRVQITRGAGKLVYAALKKKVDFFAAQVLDDVSWRDTLQSAKIFWPLRKASFIWGLADMALVATLQGEGRAKEAVTRVFEALPWLGYDIQTGTIVSTQFYMPPISIPLAYDLAAPWLSADIRRAYVDWASRVHIDAIINALSLKFMKSAGANIPLGGMEMAMLTTLAIDGDRGSHLLVKQKTTLTRWLEAAINAAITPDGYPQEDIGYGTVVAPTLMQVAFAAERAGLLDIKRHAPRLLKFGRAMLHFTQPFGEHLSLTGDHGDQFRDRQFALGTLAADTGDKSLRWLIGKLSYAHYRTLPGDDCVELDAEIKLPHQASVPVSWLTLALLDELRLDDPKSIVDPAKARPAISTTFHDRSRGLISFRSAWKADDTFVVFDAGQRSAAAPGHHHCSSGHFSITAKGELFAIDTGRYNIEQSQHNVVLVDGRSGRSTQGEWIADYHPGRLIECAPAALCDFAAVDSSHQHNCMWAYRSLGLVKPLKSRVPAYVWTVEDINANNNYGNFWWTLNTCPGNTIKIHDNHATIQGWRHGNLLDVHLIIPPAEEYAQPHTLALDQDVNSTSSYKYVADPDRAAANFPSPQSLIHGPVFKRPRLIAKVFGANGRFLSIMLPREKRERMAKVTQLRSLENSLAFRIDFNDAQKTSDTLIWAYDHNLLEADGVVARGQWCLVRRGGKTRKVIAHQIHQGDMLEVGGKKII